MLGLQSFLWKSDSSPPKVFCSLTFRSPSQSYLKWPEGLAFLLPWRWRRLTLADKMTRSLGCHDVLKVRIVGSWVECTYEAKASLQFSAARHSKKSNNRIICRNQPSVFIDFASTADHPTFRFIKCVPHPLTLISIIELRILQEFSIRHCIIWRRKFALNIYLH